ncbi:hypothetical protein HS088_TW22G00522 [Tripterygium wilfordii]|uniref:Uncharacterized protein n=1 Tax=Tripterygium wilfordii TaxID=458696 RepID=A0A7J7BYE6_TRIWF|nr:hypothetical protein HS088_TW22G00522 [Tripterygium wilfordii]
MQSSYCSWPQCPSFIQFKRKRLKKFVFSTFKSRQKSYSKTFTINELYIASLLTQKLNKIDVSLVPPR